MQKSLTWILVIATVVLAFVIVTIEKKLPDARQRAQPPRLFSNVDPSEVNRIQINLGPSATIIAEKTDEHWVLRAPNYSAQQATVENFVTNLLSLRALDRIAPHDVALQGAKGFGLEPSRATIEVTAGTNRLAFQVGARTPLTNNVYLRLQPSGEVVVTGAEAAALVPANFLAWRDPRLVDLASLAFDRLRVRVGPRTFELARNETNRSWQLTKPIPARADQGRMAALLDLLRNTPVAAFISESPSELESFGLGAPELELSFLKATNLLYAVEFGATYTNEARLVYARLLGHSNVVLVARELVDFLRQPYKNFHDPQLLSLQPSAIDQISIKSTEHFSLRRGANSRWMSQSQQGTNLVDLSLAQRFFSNIVTLEIVDIVKEVPSDTDLAGFGLLTPTASFGFFRQTTNASGVLTNVLLSELTFGTNSADRIFARRSDELPVYVVPLAQMLALPRERYELRDRQIWNIPVSNIVRVIFSNSLNAGSIQRKPNGLWSDDVITHEAISESVLRLASPQAMAWAAKGEQRKAVFGIRPNGPTLGVEVKNGTETNVLTLELGNLTMRRDIYAAIVFPNEKEPVIFELSGVLFHSLIQLISPVK